MKHESRVAATAPVLVALLPSLAASLFVGCAVSESGSAPTTASLVQASEAKQEAFNEKLPLLEKIQEALEAELFVDERVQSIGIGLDEDGRTPHFVVVVDDEEAIDHVPRTFEGVAVEIHTADPLRLTNGAPACGATAANPCHADQQSLPVEMGNSTGWQQSSGFGCTLGFKACDPSTRESVFVTAAHCAYSSSCGPGAGDFKHVAPGDAQSGGSPQVVGTITGHAAPSCTNPINLTDATKLTSPYYLTSKSHRDIGTLASVPTWAFPSSLAHFSGRTSGHHVGVVVATNATVRVPAASWCCSRELTMVNQIIFASPQPIVPGDSGAGLLSKYSPAYPYNNFLIGLMWGSSGTIAYANQIGHVLTALGLTLDFDQCGFYL